MAKAEGKDMPFYFNMRTCWKHRGLDSDRGLMPCSATGKQHQSEEKVLQTYWGQHDFKFILQPSNFFSLVNCMYSPLLSQPPVPRAYAPHQKLETLQEAGTKIAFQWARFHAGQETGARR